MELIPLSMVHSTPTFHCHGGDFLNVLDEKVKLCRGIGQAQSARRANQEGGGGPVWIQSPRLHVEDGDIGEVQCSCHLQDTE